MGPGRPPFIRGALEDAEESVDIIVEWAWVGCSAFGFAALAELAIPRYADVFEKREVVVVEICHLRQCDLAQVSAALNGAGRLAS